MTASKMTLLPDSMRVFTQVTAPLKIAGQFTSDQSFSLLQRLRIDFGRL